MEFLYLVVLTVLLLARTFLSIWVAEVMGFNASALVEMDQNKFISGVLKLGILAIPASVVNSGLKYFTNMLSIRFRYEVLETTLGCSHLQKETEHLRTQPLYGWNYLLQSHTKQGN